MPDRTPLRDDRQPRPSGRPDDRGTWLIHKNNTGSFTSAHELVQIVPRNADLNQDGVIDEVDVLSFEEAYINGE